MNTKKSLDTLGMMIIILEEGGVRYREKQNLEKDMINVAID